MSNRSEKTMESLKMNSSSQDRLNKIFKNIQAEIEKKMVSSRTERDKKIAETNSTISKLISSAKKPVENKPKEKEEEEVIVKTDKKSLVREKFLGKWKLIGSTDKDPMFNIDNWTHHYEIRNNLLICHEKRPGNTKTWKEDNAVFGMIIEDDHVKSYSGTDGMIMRECDRYLKNGKLHVRLKMPGVPAKTMVFEKLETSELPQNTTETSEEEETPLREQFVGKWGLTHYNGKYVKASPYLATQEFFLKNGVLSASEGSQFAGVSYSEKPRKIAGQGKLTVKNGYVRSYINNGLGSVIDMDKFVDGDTMTVHWKHDDEPSTVYKYERYH